MKNLDLKQKKIILIIVLIIVLIIYYYFSTKDSTDEIDSQNLEITNTENIEEKEEEKIVVHITGAVNKEGIVELETGARIADAIEKAGGSKENADIKNINLATILEDGMKIHIPTIEETNTNKDKTTENNENSQTITETIDNASDTKKTQGKVNINTANIEELDTLPGIGPSTASKIISYRQENGKFKNIEELKEVSGIGEAKYEKIKDLITIK